MIESGAFRGVALELYASATAPARSGRYSAPEFIRHCRAHGLAVVSAVSAAPTGIPNLYEATIDLEEAGAVFVHDMLPETALVKLMWVLAQPGGSEAFATRMLDPVAEDLRVR
jgi:L-asparaginase/Glu-tRNA(Gln) amidotransferase subunit D